MLPLADPLLEPLLNTLPEQAVPELLAVWVELVLVCVEFSGEFTDPLEEFDVVPPLYDAPTVPELVGVLVTVPGEVVEFPFTALLVELPVAVERPPAEVAALPLVVLVPELPVEVACAMQFCWPLIVLVVEVVVLYVVVGGWNVWCLTCWISVCTAASLAKSAVV
ncbi:hypothetical protein [Acidiphilium sp. 20-67-58]|uniref:hypothetical protein n=1 Tax=Acidiphilium sp. 20-67-58 TaxID=1970291 RepID=UPI0025BD0E27|nr:hypothetical protein [Acidiphilium sp. 20-67-58]